jgi:hypothetical protein
MNLKKMIFINTGIAFLLAFLCHFLYTWLPNPVFSIFFPVNESIWEHMKMLYTTILLSGIIEYIIMKKNNIDNNNFLLNLFIKSILSIPIYLVIFLPIFYNIGENMFIAISTMLISIFIVNLIGYKILQIEDIPYQRIIAILSIVIVYIIMGILTYKPPKTDLFFDTKDEKYGINDYLTKE